MTKKKDSTKKTGAEELDAFAHHLAEVLRIARTHPALPARLYSALSTAWNDAQEHGIPFYETSEYVKLAVAAIGRKHGKGGAE